MYPIPFVDVWGLNTNPGPDVERRAQYGRGQEPSQEMAMKGEITKKGQVPVTGVVSSVIVLLYPTRNFLGLFPTVFMIL